ncbi:Cytosine/purines, uracil, thiamine, allantoin permease family protein (modular protein) [Xenorhabdus bovienii str. feltiae Florida]|nr:Cytosine/purines, uracil, thiamine, allantoin permease family protein (modular protein) [Xenorhabdus bovienii str. feltiae France]CDG92132.1 Cytosine/purines, uracil, thiamine, allantoin permease family protein (modular protein) [Xenorhabdus bovienii str. feltiae Florida]
MENVMGTQQNNQGFWKVEHTGIDIVPPSERTGTPMDLFWIWSAANIGILGIIYGAIIVSFKLSFLQSALAVLIGLSSFALVGYLSFSGKLGRTSTLTLSRNIFGIRGNIAPTMIFWGISLGWESINIVTGTLTLSALFQACGLAESTLLTVISMILFAGLSIGVTLLGKEMLIAMQRWIIHVFGAMTLVVVFYILFTTEWEAVLAMPSGSWLTGFLPAVSVVAAGTGIAWAATGADYSRYQSESSSKLKVFTAVTAGGMIPLVLLLFAGILLSVQLPNLPTSENPIAQIGSILPDWMVIPYLMTATAGIVTMAVLSLYSASLNFLTLGIKVKQIHAVTIDSIIVLTLAIYLLFVTGDFMGPFVSFLLFCGVFLAPWEAVFLLDYIIVRRKQGYCTDSLYNDIGPNGGIKWIPVLCWLLGAFVGFLVTKNDFISGPWAVGIFANSSLGLFLSFFVSFICYGLYLMLGRYTR